MKTYRYVKMDPTGNITVLVTDPVPRNEQPVLARRLMEEPSVGGEQVGFLETPEDPSCRIRLQMMGGEFCGNATMCAAALMTAGEDYEETSVRMEVSGAEGPLDCRIRKTEDGWAGTVKMPAVKSCRETVLPRRGQGVSVTEVRMDGIVHLILQERIERDEDAETVLKSWAGVYKEDAVGLLQWDEEKKYLRPLVLVKATGTAVWENGCGSGSAAIGAWKALSSDEPVTVTEVAQPGGTILTETVKDGDRIRTITITGKVRPVREGTVTL